jgi:hypothetical protein
MIEKKEPNREYKASIGKEVKEINIIKMPMGVIIKKEVEKYEKW